MSKSTGTRFAIIGGGLGGTPAAIMLQNAGYDVKVYEQARRLERVGAGINLFPNAVRALRGTGLVEALINAALRPVGFVQRRWDTGEETFNLRLNHGPNDGGPDNDAPDRDDSPHLILHRADLQRILTSGLAPGVLELGRRLVGMEDKDRAVLLEFEDGSRAEADLVIGADGINSKVREILLGPEPPTYTGHVAHRAIFPSSLLGGLRVADSTRWWADDRYCMVYYLQEARDEVYFVTGAPESWDRDEFTPVPTETGRLRAVFEGFHPEVQHIIEACPRSMTWPVLYRDPYVLWNRGRVVMLGDACHPMKPHIGQGAAMAMEDAAMLVRCIQHTDGEDPVAAVALYRSLRFERTTRVKIAADEHHWWRPGRDFDWLLGYDVFEEPLVSRAPPATDGSTTATPR